jgi:hypothetical protein
MKWLSCIIMIQSAWAASEYRTFISKIERWQYEKGKYEMILSQSQTRFEVPADSHVRPCLDNAYKAQMEVLVTVDPAAPKVISCKVYSQGLPYTPSVIEKQAQEEGEQEKVQKR